MSAKQQADTPVTTTQQIPTDEPSRISRLKLAFMYVLIGGLAASALTAIIALLVGSFNSEIQKSLLTIFIFFTHSLFILALLWSDKHNQVGQSILPTSLFVLALANMVTTTLSTWEIISSEGAWRALGLYVLILGAVFVITGLMQLFINHKATKIGIYASIGTISVLVASLVPWVLHIVGNSGRFDPFYFRLVAALAILASTVFIITVILRAIALARQPELKQTKPASKPIPQGLLAIYITVGVITALVWWSGLAGFVITAIESSQPVYQGSGYSNRYY
jgi:hypothetical protein